MPRTTYCPKSHEELASVSVGKPYGHTPGHKYHDVDALVSSKGDKFRCHVVESWGSAQGYDEEHGRREVTGRGGSVVEAIAVAERFAKAAGIDDGYLASALSQVAAEAGD
jgi:hypothetical protein